MTENDPFLRPTDGSQPERNAQPDHSKQPPQWAATPAPTYSAPQAPPPPTYGAPAPGYGPAPTAYGASAATYGNGSAAYGVPAGEPTTSGDYDGVSIGALVTGLLSMGPVAVVLGAIGLRRTAGGQRKGTWMAVTGVVLGVLACMVWTAVFTAAITATQAYVEPIETELGDFFDSDQAYGDDVELDALYDQCEAGDNAACNDLYWGSDIGSEYESFAETCGGRETTPMGGFCEE